MMIRRKITSATAESSSVPLMFSKTLIASAEKPAPPVTFTSSPPPGSLTTSRMSSTGSMIVLPWPLVRMSPETSAVVRSREIEITRKTRPSRWRTSCGYLASSRSTRAMSARMRAWSAAVSPPSRR